MTFEFSTGLVWFRRDLRLQDNPALAQALQRCAAVHCVFIFDREILDPLPRRDRRVAFIQQSLVELDAQLRAASQQAQTGLIVMHAASRQAIPALAHELGVQAVFAAHDYEPVSLARDCGVTAALQAHCIGFFTCKDHVVFERQEVLTQTGKPYSVFTPYLRAWSARLEGPAVPTTPLPSRWHALAKRPERFAQPVPDLPTLGFESFQWDVPGIVPGTSGAQTMLSSFWERIDRYDETRNFPAVKGPSYLGVHLRFGTVSIRQLVALALQRRVQGSSGASIWFNELAWRDFYFQILANFPHVVGAAFKPEYDQIQWVSGALADRRFLAWCEGRTGYPLVDAAMAQLNQSGYMHNRLRMVAGSFLVKHLGIDWRWGERYFAEKLNDFDLASNNGGWQWVSSSGCDAQPYFRIFNPVSQSEKFDAQGIFIRRYLPQLKALDVRSIHAPWQAKPVDLAAANVALGRDYPHPIVDHAQARTETLERYAVVKKRP